MVDGWQEMRNSCGKLCARVGKGNIGDIQVLCAFVESRVVEIQVVA